MDEFVVEVARFFVGRFYGFGEDGGGDPDEGCGGQTGNG
jgi:hypothetical protein